ncbi:MAG: DUF342 domain-containing protein [Planctomycetes bacterium]|nr:DUF342 domain-containing protein [Planctomycetota bacterium]
MPWQIDINSNKTIVRLDLKKFTASEGIGYGELIETLQKKQIPLNPTAENHIRELLEQLDQIIESDLQPILIESKGPADGQDGRFEWSDEFDPEKECSEDQDQEAQKGTDFYSLSSLIIAKKDDTLGILHSATEGESGEDVFERDVPPKAGVPFKLEPGANVKLLGDGKTFIAECDGEPKIEGGKLKVEPMLTINSDVDFETGNIAFSGDVLIKGDVKDLFCVQTGGNLNVEGTIEAAQIECQGALAVKRGISGKEKGSIEVKKDLAAKYLSNVQVWVEGNIEIESEIVNTNLNCRGNIKLQRGAIHGGQVSAAGNIEAPNIGSPAGVRTIVRSGVDPFLEEQIKEQNQLKIPLVEQINEIMPNAKAILAVSGGRPNDELKKMADQIQQCKLKIEDIDKKHQHLTQEMEKNCTGAIIVHKTLYPGVILYVKDKMQVVEHEMTGPLEVVINHNEAETNALSFQAATPEKVK